MGYDNRVHIVAIHENNNEKSHWAEHLMTIELRGMANGFKELFDKEVEEALSDLEEKAEDSPDLQGNSI